jgi:hypothetical protein
LAFRFGSHRLDLHCLLGLKSHPCFEHCLFVVGRDCCTYLESFIMDTFIKVASEVNFDIVVVELCNLAINQLVKLLQLPSSIIMVFIVTM